MLSERIEYCNVDEAMVVSPVFFSFVVFAFMTTCVELACGAKAIILPTTVGVGVKVGETVILQTFGMVVFAVAVFVRDPAGLVALPVQTMLP